VSAACRASAGSVPSVTSASVGGAVAGVTSAVSWPFARSLGTEILDTLGFVPWNLGLLVPSTSRLSDDGRGVSFYIK